MNSNDICDNYEDDLNLILDAWQEGPWPTLLFDGEGHFWPVPANQMGRDDIIRYVEARYGPMFAKWTAQKLTLH